MRRGDGKLSEWLANERSPCQGCVVAHQLFNAFFAAVLYVALSKVSSYNDLLREMVRVRKGEKWSAAKKCTVAWQI